MPEMHLLVLCPFLMLKNILHLLLLVILHLCCTAAVQLLMFLHVYGAISGSHFELTAQSYLVLEHKHRKLFLLAPPMLLHSADI